ncbi:MAG: L-seryl-tRNA(Sec) selenium transferase, partial [Chloroflexi bacterium]|nr:L-seryl-tRNA(Sec) selenium transferase [Chloroflexota bacterium]
MDNKFRSIPSVDKVILDLRLRPLLEYLAKDIIVIIVREELEKIRNAISNDEICPSYDSIVGLILDKIILFNQIGTKKIINATGVILHTNLGRAPLSRETIAAMQIVAE